MKAAGRLNPTTTPAAVDKDNAASKVAGPAVAVRTACATTDFAMQNVILQMNLELLSVDGMKVRRLKSWVSRCGACFTVFSNDANNGPYEAKRLFCSRCGSDMIQRIACSVDSKTGRLRLHLSKKYKTNVRGTKFSLPKPGSNNRFQGDLLLREDQMLMGAWNQKVKKLSGGKSKAAASSMFGSDLAANVGCHAKTVHADDVRVGFGRRNPNSAKGGRERRGKKKKTGDKACGLRRY
jgi:RNA-binding protein NOB1